MNYLNRAAAPFGERVWQTVDEAVVGAARSRLVGRRFIDAEGPYGLGFTAVDGDAEVSAATGERPALLMPRPVTVPAFYQDFPLALRDIETFETLGHPLNVGAAVRASLACASLEDDLIFNGNPKLGVEGLLSASGRSEVQMADWSQLGQPFLNVSQAIAKLDAKGFPGPYVLAVAPDLYSSLHLMYEASGVLQIEQVRGLVTGGIFKAPSIAKGGVLAATGKQLRLYLGQDLATGYRRLEGLFHWFFVSESILLRIYAPEAICVLKG